MTEVLKYSPELGDLSQQYINERVGELADCIRDLSSIQTDIWRQLPYFALQAEGLTDNNNFNIRLFRQGLLTINGYPATLCGTFVDCDNGNILSLQGEEKLDSLAGDTDVVTAWFPRGENFNANTWMNLILINAFKPYGSYSDYNEARNQRWRYDTVLELDLRSVFARSRNPQEP
jgi:hypothetical protein